MSYTTTDHLGSPRVITNALGQVTSRRDFLPFGEEITPNVGSRTASLGYGTSDNIRQKFTGYQKDEETALDFAEAIILGFSRLCLSICGEALLHRLRRFRHLRLRRPAAEPLSSLGSAFGKVELFRK